MNNPAAGYVTAPKGTLSTSGRNTERMNPINDIDATIAKNVAINEKFKASIRRTLLQHPQPPAVRRRQHQRRGPDRIHQHPGAQLHDSFDVGFPRGVAGFLQQSAHDRDLGEVHLLRNYRERSKYGEPSGSPFFVPVKARCPRRGSSVSWTRSSLPADMPSDGHIARGLIAACLWCAALHAQVAITGRVVDENGAAVDGARVELRAAEGGVIVASSDQAGNFKASLPAAGDYAIRAERLGFFVFTNTRQGLRPALNNHHQAESPAGILRQDRRHLLAAGHRSAAAGRTQGTGQHRNPGHSVPCAAGLPQRPAVARRGGAGQRGPRPFQRRRHQPDELYAGRIQHLRPGDRTAGHAREHRHHSVHGPCRTAASRRRTAAARRACWISRPRWATTACASAAPISSRESPPMAAGISTNGRRGWNSPGRIAKGRAWFHNGIDAFYSNDTIHGLPNGQNRTSGLPSAT